MRQEPIGPLEPTGWADGAHAAAVDQAHLDALRRLPLPEPSQGSHAYRRERRLALLTSPRRAWNYYKASRNGRTKAEVDYLPTRIDIENVSRCNFHCTMCQVSDWTRGKRADDLSYEDFCKILDEQYGVYEIKLQGVGEPLLQGDDVFKMIRYARARHIWVRTTTNGSLLHLNDNYRKLIDTDVNEVQISIDGATKASFEAIRRGAHFETIMRNCQSINAYSLERGVERTKMWTVVQRGNIDELPQLVELAAHLGFKSQVFALNLVDWGSAVWRERNDAVSILNTFSVDLAHTLIAMGDRLGVKVRFWTSQETFSLDQPKTRCPWPFERAYVSSDKRVVPCCLIANPDSYEIKAEGSLSEVWKSDTYRKFREGHLTGDMPDICKICYDSRQ